MSERILHIDFETRSTVDLVKSGLDNYARDPTTTPWCMGYAFDAEDVKLWKAGEPLPAEVEEHIFFGGIAVGHNVGFELAIWNHICVPRFGWPTLRPEQTRCTMAMAYAMALPGSLEKASLATGIGQRKDMIGSRLMKQMASPKKTDDGRIEWWGEPEKLIALYEYCKQDVRVERELDNRLCQLSDQEFKVWLLDYKINQRGVYIDHKAVNAAHGVAAAEIDALDDAMRETTKGFVSFCTETARLKEFILSKGIDIEGVAKADITELLEYDKALPDFIPKEVTRAVEIRREAGKTSTAKLKPMIEASSIDHRVRGMFQYHGAGTGRWAGRRVQLHNLPRPKWKHKVIDEAIEAMTTRPALEAAQYLRALIGRPLDVVSSSLRGMIAAAPGNIFYTADYSNIEGRGIAWLAGEEFKLERFRLADAKLGPGIYESGAADILGITVEEVTEFMRQAYGKTPELACGYGGGVGAFQTMAKNFGITFTDDQANQIKDKWREAHPNIVKYWYALEEAALNAVMAPGKKFTAGPVGRQVCYKVQGSFLWCMLPSGRVLCYPYPRVVEVETPWGTMKDAVTYMVVVDEIQKKKKGKILPDPQAGGDWQRVSTYGGKLSENITQAICRDILVDGMWAAEAAGYPIVLHVHDELVAEVPEDFGDLKEFEKLCCSYGAWANGLPVVAEGWTGKRYRK